MSIVEFANDAASSTTPAAVTHERSLRGERKKDNDACDVWVSSTSANANEVVGRARGCTKPSVNIDEPLSLNAERQLETPSAWNIIMNPTITIASHTTGCTSSVSGAYSAMTRSRPS